MRHLKPFAAAFLCASSAVLLWSFSAERSVDVRDCSFSAAPDEFLRAGLQARQIVDADVRKLDGARRLGAAEASSTVIQRRNFIDDEIFGRLERFGVQPAPLAGDEEFFRRVTLDLTGRIPSPPEIRSFVADRDPGKRDRYIERLLDSPEFVDKWTMWLGDLLQNTRARLSTQGLPRTVESRNALHAWLRKALISRTTIRDIAWASVATSGNNFSAGVGPVNFILGGQAAMGPAQDSYDMMMVKSATAFLGMAHYDCLSCHSGRGHLDELSLWGRDATRLDAWKMSAHFARTRWTVNNRREALNVDPNYNSVDISDASAGDYVLNTTAGNRPARCAEGKRPDPASGRCVAVSRLTPQYRTGETPSGGNWRAAFADRLVADPMFARNFANRLWKAMFNLGLVDPVDTLDPARLDPANPPPAPWTLQASHPELLEKLAAAFVGGQHDLRAFLRLLVQSSAYQLSSQYAGEWKYEYIPLFARHYPRRLDAEEIHDAVVAASGVASAYAWPLASAAALPQGAPVPMSEPVSWAMQLPDTVEGGRGAAFLNAFLRGNRDTQPRSRSGSIVQGLTLMNDTAVLSRIRVNASAPLRAAAALPDEATVDELFLRFLSRLPNPAERALAIAHLQRAATPAARNTAVEDLAWAAVNKLEFRFSY